MALSHRVERIAEQVREELSQILATEVSDPGVGLVTITRVKVTADLSLARAYWTVLGDAKERTQTAKALNRAVPYLRHLLSQRLTLRRAPEVKFQYDESVAAHDRIERIIQDLHVEREAHPELKALVDPAPDPGAAGGLQAARGPDGSGSGPHVETLIQSEATLDGRTDAKKDDPAQ
jgi:ribosome-binding factor A